MTNPADGLEPQDEAARPLAGGVPCTDCARSARYRWPAVSVSKADAYQALARCYTQVALLGGLREIRVRNATGWGRAEWIELASPDGRTSRIRADDLRLALLRFGPPVARELYSMNCTIRDSGDGLVFENGRGFGHGVGLCQYGAQGKALRGMKYHEILYSYYPGARIAQMQ
jgi:stage II sporulation protein D